MKAAERTALLAAASWCDEEYRRLAMVPERGSTEDAVQLVGMRAAYAEMAACIRSWVATGAEPKHRAVSMQNRAKYLTGLRQEETSPSKDGAP